jgi:hypothetical protein
MFDDIDSRTLIHLIATQTSWTATIGIPLIECLDVAAFITGPWAQRYKAFYNSKLLIFSISYSVCPWQPFPA